MNFQDNQKKETKTSIAFSKGYAWFLCLNIVCCTWLMLWNIYTPHAHYQSSNLTAFNICIISFAAINLIFYVTLKQSIAKKLYQRLLPAIVLVFSLLWAAILFTLIALYQNTMISLCFMLIILLPATIAFYISGKLLLIFSVPLILAWFCSDVGPWQEFNLLQIAAYFIIMAVIYSARYILLEWYQRSQRSEYEKNLLIQKLTKLAHYDSLTGLYNKSSLATFYHDSIRALEKRQEKLFLIVLDIDFFKQYNDIYGHVAGDECLLKTSQCIENSLRQTSDAAFRFGGEEFVVITHCKDIGQAIKISHRIKANIAAAKIPHQGSEVSSLLTVSQGIAQWQPGMNLKELLEAADKELYKAKRGGRNAISFMK
ncbi:GGDEF domain-containing protein [Buttiauxella sp. B2]|uniref:GGDEF domain-containing protein n=1 Tax=Buttiauxella sp. B2 TaxID=2587812 RepID=UPI0016746BAB|nr:membrane-associated sensor domain-containing protein [Buttiauxella sp. B2]